MGRLAVAALALVTGCGRIAFDARFDGGASGDGTGDGTADTSSIDPTLAVWLPFDSIDLTGRVVPDGSGNGHDASCATFTCPGLYNDLSRGQVMQFDGNSDAVVIPSTPALTNLTELTVAYWINDFDNNTFQCAAGKRLGTGNKNSWQSCLDGNQMLFAYADNGTTIYQAVTTANAVLPSVWAHIAVRWRQSTNSISIAVDGTTIAQASSGMTAWDTGDIIVGGDIDTTTPGSYYNGLLDDFRLYNRVLSDAEVTALSQQ